MLCQGLQHSAGCQRWQREKEKDYPPPVDASPESDTHWMPASPRTCCASDRLASASSRGRQSWPCRTITAAASPRETRGVNDPLVRLVVVYPIVGYSCNAHKAHAPVYTGAALTRQRRSTRPVSGCSETLTQSQGPCHRPTEHRSNRSAQHSNTARQHTRPLHTHNRGWRVPRGSRRARTLGPE